jgi:hypothetical protein
MSNLAFVAILAGLAVVGYVVYTSREGFESAFLDKGNDKKTEQTRVSSYRQETNNFKPTQSLPVQPAGLETPYRVNAWNSYVPA